MDDTLLSRAYRIFQKALESSVAERESFLAAQASDDREAAAEAREMLRRFEADNEPEVGIAMALPEWARNREGSRVNEWVVGPRLGDGGFGTVYRATRPAPGGEEAAAIKFLDMAPRQVERFLRERQILADLNHEGICKFLDGGASDRGVPYMVMQLVAGLPITSHCDQYQLTITDRLKLFVRLCHAVEYAHQRRVLHRDLKPGNIYATANGAIHVLDFGIARLMDDTPGSQKPLTKPGDSPWSKAYASPEQVQGGRLSFATDVYALGVLAYELVSGHLPFSEFALSGRDWMRVICEREPLPPSHALLIDTGDSAGANSRRPPETVARSRGATPSALKRTLAGNLDAVILKALARQPANRYQRVDRLRYDIERFLDGMPVSARRSGLWERSVHWGSKHRFTATVAVSCAAWSVGILNVALLQDLRTGSILRQEHAAVRRLGDLAGNGLPRLERSLPRTAAVQQVRLELARAHSRLLRRLESMPSYARTQLDLSAAGSALECAEIWRELGNLTEALDATDSVAPRVARRYQSDSRDSQWREIYIRILRQRIEIYRELQINVERAAAEETLAAIEAGRR
jgi:eukaryotic-like serine/threonine-protein kinase